MSRAVIFVTGAFVLGFVGAKTPAPPDSALFTDEEITAKYRAITPKDSDFAFSPPAPWGPNIVLRASTWTARGKRRSRYPRSCSSTLGAGSERRAVRQRRQCRKAQAVRHVLQAPTTTRGHFGRYDRHLWFAAENNVDRFPR